MKRGIKKKYRVKETRNKRTKRSRKTTLKFLRAHLEANNIWLRNHPVDTLTFYRKHLGFEEPSLVLLDPSIFYYLASNGITLDHIKDVIKDPKAVLRTTRCVLRELDFCSSTYSSAGYPLDQPIQLARSVELEGCLHGQEITAYKCIRSLLGIYNSEKMFLATKVNHCWPLVDKNPLIPIITVEHDSLMLKELSKRRRARNWCRTAPIETPAVTDTELRDSPNFQTLLERFASYGFAGEITVNDSESQFKAISEQLDPSIWPYEAVKGFVLNQLLLHSERYENRYESQSRYLSYLVYMSRDGQWGDVVTLQAAADFFGVKIVVVNSFKEGVPVSQYTPYGVQHPKKAIYLSCLCIGDELYYNSLQRVPTESYPRDLKNTLYLIVVLTPEEH